MISSVIVVLAMLTSLYYAGIISKELADLSQWVVQSERPKTMQAWYTRNRLVAFTLAGLFVAWLVTLTSASVVPLAVVVATSLVVGVLLFSGYLNPKWMMRARQRDGVFVSNEDAKAFHDAHESMIVIEVNGEARAHADKQLLRPHVAGNGPLGGKDVVMTYCGLSNLGVAVKPEIDGKPVALRPMTQLENNLVLVDDHSDEPIQQLWLRKECDVVAGRASAMQEIATFRMPFAKFCQAYPQGQVYVNDYLQKGLRTPFAKNPVKYIYDRAMELIFSTAIAFQKSSEKPVFPTIKRFDQRLGNKELVWGFNIADDYVAYTEKFVIEQGGTINVLVGGKPIVISYDKEFESLGVFYAVNTDQTGPVDVFGKTDFDLQLERVETVKAGCFWMVWSNFFPSTDLNRL